jgi:hypothetical protein
VYMRPKNAYGTGSQSAGYSFTTAGVPTGAATISSVTVGTTTATVNFSVAAGGGAITGYDLYVANFTNAWNNTTGSPISVTGLTANTTYTFYVRAKNAYGVGPQSAGVGATTDFATFGSVEYLSIDGGATGVLNGGNHGTWRQGSQTLFSGSGIVVTVGAAGSASTCGNMSAATVYSFGKGSDGAGDYNLGHNGSGGGGGAGGTGGNGSGNQGGNGGPGRSTSITGSAVTYAGGGGGQSHRNGGGVGVATGL